MAGMLGYLGQIGASASKVQERIVEAFKHSQKIRASWEGEDQKAFQEVYSDLNKRAENTNEKYRRIENKIRTLQLSIEAADRDKAQKGKSIKR